MFSVGSKFFHTPCKDVSQYRFTYYWRYAVVSYHLQLEKRLIVLLFNTGDMSFSLIDIDDHRFPTKKDYVRLATSKQKNTI